VSDLLRAVEEISQSKDFFSEENLLEFCRKRPESFTYLKRDFLIRRGFWRGKVADSLLTASRTKFLITGHSDKSFGFFSLILAKVFFKAATVWTSNLAISFPLARTFGILPIPLGLSNPTNESRKHEVLGRTEPIIEVALGKGKPKFSSIYANFDSKTAPIYRNSLKRLCQKLPHVLTGEVDISQAGRERYLKEMRSSGLVLCPRGNGLDTHRFYEALYVGAVPIVLKRSYSARIAKELKLPHITVRHWREIRDLREIKRLAKVTIEEHGDLSCISKTFWLSQLEALDWKRYE
jgi:hypothetical protein